MPNESTNPVSGSDNVDPSTALDNPENLNFEEAEDDQPNPETEAEGTETEREPDDTQSSEEAAESEETEPETDEAVAETEPGDVLLTLKSGRQVKMADVESEMMMQADYTRKSQDNANSKRELEATAQRVNGTIEAFSQYLASQLPEKPTAALAYSDPQTYTQQNAAYEAALQQVNTIIGMGQQAKDATSDLSQADLDSKLRVENAALVEKLPHLSDPAKRDEFNRQTFQTAMHFGFSAEELNGMVDHRILMMGHHARLGLEAEQAKVTVKLKTKEVPAATPAAKRNRAPDGKFKSQKDAMAKLGKSGSIHDAMDVDFD